MLIRCKCVCDMIKMHNNKMSSIKSCSHPPPCTLTHYYPVPSTPTHYFKSFLTYSHSFSVFFHPLPLMFSSLLLILNSPPTMGRLSPHFQPISECSHPILLITYHSNSYIAPVFYVSTYFAYLCTYVPLCFMCSCTYKIHFYALYCLCLYILHAFVCVNT